MSGIYLLVLRYTPESVALLVWLLFLAMIMVGVWFSAKMMENFEDSEGE